MKKISFSKSGIKRYISALSLAFIILTSYFINFPTVWAAPNITTFQSDLNPVDVSETVEFSWSISGVFQESYINFGDGFTEIVTVVDHISHEYATEGSYQVMLTVFESSTEIVNKTLNLIVENIAPEFNISFSSINNIAGEDEIVNISITDLVDSEVDMVPGVLTYVYNFADGAENQVTTNESSITHSWRNAGVYPVTVTVIDDQGALNQMVKSITIVNSPPQARIGFGLDNDYGLTMTEYIATYDWRDAIIDSTPNGWDVTYIDPYQWFEPTSTRLEVVEEGGIHQKVVKLQDGFDKNAISMEDFFADQEFGSVEFWVKTNNSYSKSWSISLWDDSDIAFQFLMDKSDWKYTTSNNYHTIQPFYSNFEIDSPNNNTWFHVRIDFCIDNSSGDYYNLRSQQFRITINDIQSKVYEIDNQGVLGINKILIQSSISAVGVSFIDAIGYSWDPYYYVGDNRWPTTNYPDKSVFLLNAVNSTDTESDKDSLRYYWQFGDGTSAYGKYVYHQYSESGLYRVTLTVKDNNGEMGSTTRFVSINNRAPDVNFSNPTGLITIYEGETVGFNIDTLDDSNDMPSLEYWWNYEFNGTIVDPENLDGFEAGGWKSTNIYKDDYNGNVCIVAKDQEGLSAYDTRSINVLNSDPTLSIWDVGIVANTSLIITRSEVEVNLNFSINLIANGTPEKEYLLKYANTEGNFIYTAKELISLSLLKDWILVVNSSVPIPDLTWIKYDLILEFSNGEELVLSSGKFYGGSNGAWEIALNQYFYDNSNYNFKYPVTLFTHVWDPSMDDISLNILYKTNSLLLLNVSATNSSYIYNLNNINYSIDVFDLGGKTYANISFNETIASEFYDDSIFPVNLDLNFSIDPKYDLDTLLNLLEGDLGLGDLSILDCLEVLHHVYTNVTDDDGGNAQLKITFNTSRGFEFYNLSPHIIPIIPTISSEVYNITIFSLVSDYHQLITISNRMNYSRIITLNPTTPEDDYQIKIQFNTTNFDYSKMKPDGSDIRFYAINGKKLNYWIENWNATGTSTIWVKIPIADTSIINMEYGNPLVNSESNGSKVFALFDDFSNTILDPSKWIYDDDIYSNVTVSGGILRLYSDPTNPLATHTLLGFHSAWIDHGMTDGYNNTEPGATFSPSEGIWVTGDFSWVNTSFAEYLQNDVLYSIDSNITELVNPVRLLTHATQSGSEYHYGSMVSSVDTSIGTLNRALRLKVWTNLSGVSEVQVDWLAVRKCSASEPLATIGNETRLEDLKYFSGNFTIVYNNGTNDEIKIQDLTLDIDILSQFGPIFEGNLNFGNEGEYLIQVIADDGELQTITGDLITVDYLSPFAVTGDLPNIINEDQPVQLISNIMIFGNEELDESDYRFEWSFGDGTYSRIQNPIHSWSTSGTYNLTLFVVDCYGNTYIDNTTVLIEEQAPEIRGPFTFQGIEGHAIVLDLEIYDSFIDEQYLTYTWYDSYGLELSNLRNNKKPVVILEDGIYVYKLKVEDQDSNFDLVNITVIVEDLPPMVLTSNYFYSGPSGGLITLNAYVFDNLNDVNNMMFKWTLTYGNNTVVVNSGSTGIRNIYLFNNFIDTMTCIGQVTVTDLFSGKSNVATFTIRNILDNNANGVPDDYEWMVEATGIEFVFGVNYLDSDGDGLIDDYETFIGTLPDDVDSDGDGLWDGYNIYGIGERSSGTDPNDRDTDDDLLFDSTEVFGWNISSELFGIIHVTSDPLDNDTDNDGLLDGGEYSSGTNPHNPDTDSDGLTDNLDPYPTKIDADDDGLSDFREFNLGTALDTADTDEDGLTDGEELFGWGFYTNPLDFDSDHDFLSDSSELQSSKYEIDERKDLSEPISIRFDEYCSRAANAQIVFLLAFGEETTNSEYGITDVPDLNVMITKVDDKFLLFNETTNKERYFSKALDIRELIENNSLDYRGEYEIRINDTSAGCLLEEFNIEVLKYLDPNNDDYDKDGIMDGVEMGLLVKGKDVINVNNTMDSLRGIYSGSHNFDSIMENGIYYGTYDFNDEEIGTNGTNLNYVEIDNSDSNCLVQIISSVGGHKNVLELSDESAEGRVDIYNNFTTAQNYGNIEFWVRTTNSTLPTIWSVADGGTNLLRLSIENSVLRYYDGSWHDCIGSIINSNTWYHISIQFRCTGAPAYKGLAENNYYVYLDGVEYGNYQFENFQSSADRIIFSTEIEPSTYYSYLDAVGYSWDNSSHDGLGYQDIYDYGRGNINPYDITPLLAGNWDVFLSSPDIYVNQSIINDGHRGVLEIGDNSNIDTPRLIQYFDDTHSYGTIEWWWKTTNSAYGSVFRLQNYIGQSSSIILNISASNLQYYDNGYYTICPIADNTWYHMKVDFESTTGGYFGLAHNSWKISVNGIEYGDYNFNVNITEVGNVYFMMDTTQYGYLNYIDALGYSWDPNYNVGDNIHDYIGEYDEYSLEIPYLGRVYDANLQLKLVSDGIPKGNGNVTVELLKEDMNSTIPDVLLFSNFENFFNYEVFLYEQTIDLSYLIPFMTNGYYGTYRLRLKIESTYHDEIINVNEFIIETDTFIQAGYEDTEAWITNPAKWDTDGDGWSDKYEIYDRGEPTNPLSKDTDGDGVWDRFDRDPLRDIIIEINPIYGHHRNLWFFQGSPNLEITVGLTSGGSNYLFCTPTKQASADRVVRFSWWWFGMHRRYHNRKSYFNAYYYYANIDDDKRTQGNTIQLKLGLWQMGGAWDNNLISAYSTYTIGNVGHEEYLSASQRGFFGHNNYMQVKVRTLGLDKVNTIAIYDNGTTFNGHYQRQERMNIFQLYVKDSGAGTPFKEGPNVILIPTSLFTETILNKHVQDKTLNQTVLYEEEKSEFISVERNGETEAACDDIDFVFVRFEISSKDAMKVLNMLLTCLINETTNETGIVYSYASTKENGITAVMLNLPSAALVFVPWLFNYKNSAQGRQPRTFLQWLVQVIVAIVEFVVSIFVAIGEAIAAIWEQIVEVVGAVLMAVLEFLGDLLWLIIRAIILIFAWMMFGITLLFLTLAIGAIALIFLGITALIPGSSMIYTVNTVKVNFGTVSFETGYTRSMGYYEFFDLELPNINAWFTLAEVRIIEIMITFMPPKFDFHVGEDSDSIQELGRNPISEGFNSIIDDFIVEQPNRKFDEEIIHLTDSEENIRAWDLEKFILGFPEIFSGAATSADYWMLAVGIGVASIGLPSSFFVIAIIKYAGLVVAFTSYLVRFFMSDTIRSTSKNDYDRAWYFLGAGIMSLVTGIQFLKRGKPGALSDEQLAETMKKLLEEEEELTKKQKIIKFLVDMLKKLPVALINIIIMLDILTEEEEEILSKLAQFYETLYKNMEELNEKLDEWDKIFLPLELVAGIAGYLPNYDRDHKIFSYITIGIGILQIILAGLYLIEAINE